MHISVITDEIDSRLDRALDVCTELGIDAVELRTIDGVQIVDHDPGALSAMRRLLDERGFRVSAIASPFLKCDPDELHEEVHERALQAATLLRAPVVRAFSYWRQAEPQSVLPRLGDTLRHAAARARDADLVLALENEHECNVATGAEVSAALDAASSPDLRLIWDPGNAAMLDPSAFTGLGGLEPLADRVAHVHLKDVSASGSWTRIGDGIIDFRALVHFLADTAYEGFVSFETHYQRDGSSELATRDCVAAFRELIA